MHKTHIILEAHNMAKKAFNIIIPLVTFSIGLSVGFIANDWTMRTGEVQDITHLSNREIVLDVSVDAHEPVWSAALAVYLGGEAEYILPDRSRIDVITDEYAVELDWLHKWHEGVGQALHYAELSGKEPVVAIGIKEKDYDREKLKLAKRVANKNGIGVWVVRVKD